MVFTESTKLAVKRKAHFACCLCRAVGVELHHIVPQSEGGADTQENAAPLCPSCHETYGANPTKRKFIREARDFWFEICDTRYATDASRIDELQAMLRQLPTKSDLENIVARASEIRELSSSSGVRKNVEEILPDNLHNAQIDEVSLAAYLRLMYGSLTHCGLVEVTKLVLDLRSVGHYEIRSVHALLALTRGVTAEVIQERRDAGENMDYRTDAFPVRLFMALFDENYCRRFYPNVHAKYANNLWVRSAVDVDADQGCQACP